MNRNKRRNGSEEDANGIRDKTEKNVEREKKLKKFGEGKFWETVGTDRTAQTTDTLLYSYQLYNPRQKLGE